MKKTLQSTSKPNLNEFRKISGIVKIWDGKAWQPDRGQFYQSPEDCGKCKMLTAINGFEDKCDEHSNPF